MSWAGVNSEAAAIICVVSLLLACSAPAAARAPSVDAQAAVLIDTETGTVLYGKRMHERRPVASTTKVMTALLALENCEPDEFVVVSERAASATGSSLYLNAGERVKMDDLLAALLLKSANDAANAIAEHVSGTIEAFAGRMSERAQELGAWNTRFTNPHGLHDAQHYSSAYDLALITREAMTHERFRELVATETAEIELPRASNGTRKLVNHNKLVRRVDFVDGVKTGYVRHSGHCLIASGTQNGWQLIVVVLDSPEMYDEALRLLEYGFANYRPTVYAEPGDAVGRARVRGGVADSVGAICQRTLAAVVGPGIHDDAHLEVKLVELQAPVEAGASAGVARLVAGGRIVDESPLLTAEAVPRSAAITLGLWALRVLVLVTVGAVLVRTYGKARKNHRSGGGDGPEEGGGSGPRGPSPG